MQAETPTYIVVGVRTDWLLYADDGRPHHCNKIIERISMEVYELQPVGSVKSFYRKAFVTVNDDGSEILRSYDTDVMRKDADGTLHRLWSGWSATTGRHIYAFAGIRKKQWDKMEIENYGIYSK